MYGPLCLILKFQTFWHGDHWKFNWDAKFNLVRTLWGVDRWCVLKKMKKMHHDCVVKVEERNAGDMSCLLGAAAGLLKWLWPSFLFRSSERKVLHFISSQYYERERQRIFLLFAVLWLGELGYLGCKTVEVLWLVGRERSLIELWGLGLCGGPCKVRLQVRKGRHWNSGSFHLPGPYQCVCTTSFSTHSLSKYLLHRQ